MFRHINKKWNKLIERIIKETEWEVDIYYPKVVLILEKPKNGEKEYFRINNRKDYKTVTELIFGETN